MPQVPRYDRKIQDNAAPSGALNVNVSEESTGVGIGQTLQKIGSQFDKEEREARDQANEMMLLDADRELGEFENMTLYDPDDGAMTKRGSDAFELPEKVSEAYKTKVSEISKRFTDPGTAIRFKKLYIGREKGINKSVSGHVNREIQRFEDESTESHIKSSRANAVENYQDPGRIGAEISTQKTAITAWAKRNGVPTKGKNAAEYNRKMENAESQTHISVIDRMLSNDEDQLATAYFRDNKDRISGEHIAKVEKALDQSELRGESQRQSADIITKNSELDDQLEKARKIKDPKLQDEVVRRIKVYNSEVQQVKAQVQRQAQDDSWSIISEGKDIDDIPVVTWSRLNGKEQQAITSFMEKRASGQAIETDWEKYYSLARMGSKDLMDINLNNYRNDLSNAEFKQVTGWQRAIEKAGKNGIAPEGTTGQLINAALKHMPLNDKAAGQFTARVFAAIDEEQQSSGKKLRTNEKQALINQLMSDGELFREFSIFSPTSWVDPDKKAFEVQTEDERKRFFISDVPGTEKSKIESELKRLNIPVSDERILDIYNQKIQQTLLKGK